MSEKWVYFQFRNSEAGHPSWGGSVADVADATHMSANTVLPGTSYANGGLSNDGMMFGYNSAVNPASANAAATAHANDGLLAGHHGWASNSISLTIDRARGEHDLTCAMGHSVANAQPGLIVLFDGYEGMQQAQLGAFVRWAANTAFALNATIVDSTLSVWRATTAGTSGTIAPNGNGETFADGTVTWTKASVKALAALGSPTANTAVNVLDQQGQLRAAGAWRTAAEANPLTINLTTGTLAVIRAGVTPYIRNLGFRHRVVPLTGATLKGEDGVATLAAIHSHEPAGKLAFRAESQLGIQKFVLTPGHSCTTYFEAVVHRNRAWFAHTANRIPADWNGEISIDQVTDGETKTTVFTVPVIDCSTRPLTGKLGRLSSETWLAREKVRAVTRGERWPGYQGQAIASDNDQAVTGDADFRAKWLALVPDGTSWYRLRLQNGSWSNTALGDLGNATSTKDFGAGGLLIEPDAGHDPMIRTRFFEFMARKVHWRNTLFVPPLSPNSSVGYQFTNEGTSNSSQVALWVKFEGNRIGYLHDSSNSIQDCFRWYSFWQHRYAYAVDFKDNDFNGINFPFVGSGGHMMMFENNSYRNVLRDVHNFNAGGSLVPRDLGSDKHLYLESRGEKWWSGLEVYAGLSSNGTPHSDFFQNARTDAGYLFMAHPNGNSKAKWTVGTKCITPNSTPPRVYIVTSAPSGDATAQPPIPAGGIADPANPPTGTGTSVSGEVGFTYHGEYKSAGVHTYALIEDDAVHVDGVLVNAPQTNSPSNQFLISSNTSVLMPFNVVLINCINATSGIYGVNVGADAIVQAEYNSLVGAARTPIAQSAVTIEAGTVRARRNIVGPDKIGTSVPKIGGTSKYNDNNVAADFSTSATSPSRPGDVMRGTFVLESKAYGYDSPEPANGDGAAFASNISRQMHHRDGTVGARLREEHLVTVTDATGATLSVVLPIIPA